MKIQSVVSFITNNLRHKIIRGGLPSGQRIKEADIASEFKISRPPVREALKVLESEGLITIKPRRGAFVSEITQKDIWEIYTVNAVLTTLAIEFAMEKISSEDIRKLKNFLGRMEESVYQKPQDIEKYRKYHKLFHETILEIAGNNRLMQICTGLDNQTSRFSKIIFSNSSHLVASFQKHREILEAVENKNREQAKSVSHDHIIEGMKNLQNMFETSKIEEEPDERR